MRCRCTTNTLRLFIRNVAQVDLAAAPRPSFAKHLPRTSIRRQTSEAAAQHEILSSQTTISPEAFADAFAEISPDTINQLAAERFVPEPEPIITKPNAPKLSPTATLRDGMKPKVTKSSQPIPPNHTTSHEFKTPLQELLADAPKAKEPEIRSFKRLVNEGTPERPRFSGLNLKITESAKNLGDDWEPPPREPWMIEKERLKAKYPDGYRPLKRLSPDAMEGIRALHAQMPENFSTANLAKEFKVSPEAIRRILKSKWRPDSEEEVDRARRWFKRGEKVWSRWAELGANPGGKWKRMGIGARPPREKTDYVPKAYAKTSTKYQYEPDPLPQLITTSRRKITGDECGKPGGSDVL